MMEDLKAQTEKAAVDRFRGGLVGLAVGDALGTTVEFRRRGTFPPVTEMVGGGPFGLEPGQWTDDTSMALCLGESLIACRGFDARDQMERYCRWAETGYLSSNGTCFDIGNTVRSALARFRQTGDPWSGSTDPRSAGNGCIMRLAPAPMFFYPNCEAVVRYAGESSRMTHGAPECVDACRLFAGVLFRALDGQAKDEILFGEERPEGLSPKIRAIADGRYRDKDVDEIRGTGYVVDSLEAALWCFHTTGSFEEAVLRAVNLGDDADTTAAVCGQVAGAYYGMSGIPSRWVELLAMREFIIGMADALYAANRGSHGGTGITG